MLPNYPANDWVKNKHSFDLNIKEIGIKPTRETYTDKNWSPDDILVDRIINQHHIFVEFHNIIYPTVSTLLGKI